LPAQQRKNVDTLVYDAQTGGPVPIPPSERNLQTVVAAPWFKVSDQPMVLEGPCFDRNGNLLFSDVYEGRVLRLTPDKQLSVVFTKNKLGPGGLAVHKDGENLYRRRRGPARPGFHRRDRP
jgi:lactonase